MSDKAKYTLQGNEEMGEAYLSWDGGYADIKSIHGNGLDGLIADANAADSLRAENARLREALRAIAEYDSPDFDCGDTIRNMGDIAQAALDAGKGES